MKTKTKTVRERATECLDELVETNSMHQTLFQDDRDRARDIIVFGKTTS